MSQFIATVQTKFLCVAMVPISNEVSLRPRGLSFPHSLTLPDSDIQYIFTLKENTVVLSYYQLSCKLIQPKRLTQRLLVAYSDNRTLSNHKHQVEFRETKSKCQATLCLTAVIVCELLIVMFRQWNGRIFVFLLTKNAQFKCEIVILNLNKDFSLIHIGLILTPRPKQSLVSSCKL